MWLLSDITLPHLRRHALRTGLTVLGVAVGVASMVATSSITDAVLGSFRSAVEATAGRAELQATNGGAGVPEELVEEIATVPGVAAVAPLVEGFVSLAADGDTLAVFGLDVLGDEEHESQLPRSAVEVPDELVFLNRLDSVAVVRGFATARGYDLDRAFDVVGPRGTRPLVVRGFVDPVGPAKLFGGMVALMDLPAAQRLLAKEGRVDRIDVRLAAGAVRDDVRAALAAQAAGRARIEDVTVHGRKAEDLLVSLRVLLAVAGLIAVVVGFFIIFHTVTVSVTQRRREIALLGALGVPRAAVVGWLAAEALVLGVVASGLGLVLGFVLARPALAVFGDVATAWVRVPAGAPTWSAATALLGMTIGVATTFIATLVPTWSVASSPIAPALRGTAPPPPPRSRVRWAGVVAVLGLGATAVLLAAAPRTLPYRAVVAYVFGVNCLALVSFALLSPLAARALARLAAALAERTHGVRLLLASSALGRSPAAPVAVVAAIVMGLAWTLADAAAIRSLERSWLGWLEAHYQSDLVVSGGGATISMVNYPPFADDIVDHVRTLPGVREVQGVRIVESAYAGRPLVVVGVDRARDGFPLVDGAWTEVAEAFWKGEGVALSENLAHRTGLGRGDEVVLPTPSGERRLPVLGVFSDFSSGGDLGCVAVSRDLFRAAWRDTLLTRLRIWTDPAVGAAAVRSDIERRFGRTHGLHAVTFAEFRGAVRDLVHNAFSISYALLLIALVISFVGVVNFLLTAVLDRREALRTLDAIGLSAGQIRGAIVGEGALLGVLGVTVGLVAGAVLSRIIVGHSIPMINGWHFAYTFPTGMAVAVSVGCVLLAAAAGIVPARMVTRPTRRRTTV
jgi:putative ABC transport system permease protein